MDRVFTNIINDGKENFTLLPGTTVINRGGWVCINASTGQILWSTANPSDGWNPAALTDANGVIFAGAASPPTAIIALDAKTGKILKSIPTNGSSYGGASVMKGCAYNPVGGTAGGIFAGPLFNTTIPMAIPSLLIAYRLHFRSNGRTVLWRGVFVARKMSKITQFLLPVLYSSNEGEHIRDTSN